MRLDQNTNEQIGRYLLPVWPLDLNWFKQKTRKPQLRSFSKPGRVWDVCPGLPWFPSLCQMALSLSRSLIWFFLVQIKSWGTSSTSWPSLSLGMDPNLKKWRWRNRRTTQSSPSCLVENTSVTTSTNSLWRSSKVCIKIPPLLTHTQNNTDSCFRFQLDTVLHRTASRWWCYRPPSKRRACLKQTVACRGSPPVRSFLFPQLGSLVTCTHSS